MFPPGPVPAVVLKRPLAPVGDAPVIVIDSLAVTSMFPAGPLGGSRLVLDAEMVPPSASWICGAASVMFPPGAVPAVVLKRPLAPVGDAPVIVIDPLAATLMSPAGPLAGSRLVLDAEMVPPSASRICGALSVMSPPGPVPAVVVKTPVGDAPVTVIESLAVTLMCPAGPLARITPVLDAEMVPPSASWICGAASVMFPPGAVPAVVLKMPLAPVGDAPVIVIDPLAATSMSPAGPLAGSRLVLDAEMVPPSASRICGALSVMSPPGPVPGRPARQEHAAARDLTAPGEQQRPDVEHDASRPSRLQGARVDEAPIDHDRRRREGHAADVLEEGLARDPRPVADVDGAMGSDSDATSLRRDIAALDHRLTAEVEAAHVEGDAPGRRRISQRRRARAAGEDAGRARPAARPRNQDGSRHRHRHVAAGQGAARVVAAD